MTCEKPECFKPFTTPNSGVMQPFKPPRRITSRAASAPPTATITEPPSPASPRPGRARKRARPRGGDGGGGDDDDEGEAEDDQDDNPRDRKRAAGWAGLLAVIGLIGILKTNHATVHLSFALANKGSDILRDHGWCWRKARVNSTLGVLLDGNKGSKVGGASDIGFDEVFKCGASAAPAGKADAPPPGVGIVAGCAAVVDDTDGLSTGTIEGIDQVNKFVRCAVAHARASLKDTQPGLLEGGLPVSDCTVGVTDLNLAAHGPGAALHRKVLHCVLPGLFPAHDAEGQ